MIDLKAYLVEFDTLMCDMIEVLIKENSKIYDKEIYELILHTSINLKKIIANNTFDKIYNIYPFKGLNNIYNVNILAIDELMRLVSNLGNKGFYSVEINETLKKLLVCEKKVLTTICRLYIPRNKQLDFMEDIEENIYKRNLLKALTNNFYYFGLTHNPDLILYNVFETNLKDEYKLPIINRILKYHYNCHSLDNRLHEIIKR